VESARLRKISACRASSIACVAMKFFTSKKSALRRPSHLAGTSVAIISTSVKNVSSCAYAFPMSSGRSISCSSAHGMSVVAFHCRVIASS